jgi:hypothetical protein
VRTQNFTLYGNASESKTKEVGLEMERLRAVLVALKRGSAAAPVPTWMYVFKSRQALEPYLPRVDGEPAHFAGYYRGGWDANYAMLSAAWNLDPRPTVYYSYIYDFIRANFSRLPLWYETGIAGYYSTFQTEGDEARTGMISEDDVQVLRSSLMWLPLERVFAIEHDSPEYRDRERRGLYFAETWALIHYLTRGNESRTPQLSRFMELLGQGMPQDDAFREAFRTDYATLYGELVAYIRNNKRFFYNRTKFAELKPPTQALVTPMTYEDVLVRLGDLLASDKDRSADGERYYQAALAANPSSAGALGGLGALRQEQKKDEEAAALLARAVEAGSTDYRVYYAVGRRRWEALAGQPYDPGNPSAEQRAFLEAARAAFRRSIALNPDFAEAQAALGRTYRLEPPGAGLDEGIAALEAARKRLPAREDVARDLARLYERKGDQSAADALSQAAGGTKDGKGPPRASGSRFESTVHSDFDAKVARINTLLEAGKLDEGLAALDALIAESGGETRAEMEAQREKLRKVAARNRAVADYNAAVALYNKRDYAGALAAFRKVAAESPDEKIAADARQKEAEVARLLPKSKPGKP